MLEGSGTKRGPIHAKPASQARQATSKATTCPSQWPDATPVKAVFDPVKSEDGAFL